eukprot:TRINITY_DN4852_c0_g1_i12.p1 TRINITY_DN4852_c0_g1~~TRINITY_DN4852_c0_g1_i12.p1  ORF type:complete len:838 (-),score=282.55 TRINITY_DN4852_c0_g1_i12:1434-3947(-)
MFLFGGSGAGSSAEPAATSGDVDLKQMLEEKDEEIDELNAKISALRDAMEQDHHMDNWEMAMAEKNKVLAEQLERVEELTQQNKTLMDRLEKVSQGEKGIGSAAADPSEAAASLVTELQAQLAAALEELEAQRKAPAAPQESDGLVQLEAQWQQRLQEREEQNRALEEQLHRLSLELGKVQAEADATPGKDGSNCAGGGGGQATPLDKLDMEKLQALQSKNEQLQEELAQMTGGMAAGTHAIQRVAELEEQLLQLAQSEERLGESRARVIELEAQLAANAEASAVMSNNGGLTGSGNTSENGADVDEEATAEKAELREKLQASESKSRELVEELARLQESMAAAAQAGEREAALQQQLEQASFAKEEQMRASQARIAELEEQLAAKLETVDASSDVVAGVGNISNADDGWGGDLDLGVAGAASATAPVADEAVARAKAELEEKLRESEAKSEELQEELECLKEGMSAGSRAIEQVASLQQELQQTSSASEEKLRASQARVAELEAQIAANAGAATATVSDPFAGSAGMGDQIEGWGGDLDLNSSGAASVSVPAVGEAETQVRVELEGKLEASESRSRELAEELARLKESVAAAAKVGEREAALQQQLEQASFAKEEQMRASQARIAELEEQLAAKLETVDASSDVVAGVGNISNADDGWGGDLDLGVAGAASATAPVADEAVARAKAELEEKLRESEAKSEELQEELECLKEGMSAGSRAIEQVASLQQELESVSSASEEKLRASQARVAELESQLASKADAATTPLQSAPEVSLDDGWGLQSLNHSWLRKPMLRRHPCKALPKSPWTMDGASAMPLPARQPLHHRIKSLKQLKQQQ